MKRLLLAGLAFSALIMPAMAADMPLKALPPPPTWTGLYWGVNVGWIGSSQYNITNTGTDTGFGGLGTALSIRHTRHNPGEPQRHVRWRPDRL
jgi:hypothetical protein